MFDLVIPRAFFNQLPFTLKFKEQTMLHIIIVKVEDLFFYLTFWLGTQSWLVFAAAVQQTHQRRTARKTQTSHLITTGTIWAINGINSVISEQKYVKKKPNLTIYLCPLWSI